MPDRWADSRMLLPSLQVGEQSRDVHRIQGAAVTLGAASSRGALKPFDVMSDVRRLRPWQDCMLGCVPAIRWYRHLIAALQNHRLNALAAA